MQQTSGWRSVDGENEILQKTWFYKDIRCVSGSLLNINKPTGLNSDQKWFALEFYVSHMSFCKTYGKFFCYLYP